LAPNDWRADHAFEALAEVQLGLGEPSAALAVARARVERAAAQGDAADELVALEAGVALIEAAGAPGRDGAAMLDALLVRRATTGAPLEDVVALAVRAAAAWRSVGDEPRAQQALARAGLSPPEARPLLAAVPAPPAEPGEAPEAAEPAMGASVEQAAGEEPGQASGPRETLPGWYLGAPPADFLGAAGAEPTVPEPDAEPTVPEPAAAEPVVAEPTVSESAAAEPVGAAPVMAEPTVP
jgi:plasmid stability protein